ncbi:tetratricopeptide repeat protein, partial [Hyalangium sp.]|uniref:tetratricopeptide repeat protein n=1 Tax=Hyalangium sp. TaxID=2028555 RepID=UPI002D55807F
ALKLLRPRDVLGGSSHDEQGRFLREAQAMARLSHPNVVAVYDAGTLETGSLFIAMEHVEGQTLRRWQKEQRSWREVLEKYLAAGRGLAAAHAAGLVHRDFKPDNVLVGRDERARVTDFGLARLEASLLPAENEESELPSGSLPSQALETPITEPGNLMGTPRYMAPEQLRGQRADARSDLYSFCVSLYEGLYGERPFQGKTVAELRRAQRQGVTPPASSEVPAWLARTVLQGLQVDPAQRTASMAALLAELEDDPEVKRRAWLRRSSVASVTLALAVLAVWGWARQQVQVCGQLEQRLAGVWDASIQARVEQALLGTNLAYARDTAERVTAALDGYAGAWVKQRTELCLNTSREGSAQAQGLAVLEESCLERRRSQLRALTELLSQGPDPALVSKAVPAVQALPPLEYCADTKALTAAVPPPEQPEVRAKVEALQQQVDRLEALFDGGKYKEGLALAETLLPQVEPVGYAPLLARTLFVSARLKEGSGDFPGSEARLRQAMREAARGKDMFQLARAASTLIMLVGYREGRHEEALLMRPMAENLAEAADDERLRASELNNYGAVLSELGRHEEALQAWQHVLALREKAVGPEHLDVASVVNNLGLMFWKMGRFEPAREQLSRSLALREKILGPEHPQVAASFNNLGLVLWKMGRLEESRELQARALVLREKVLGPEHPDVAASLTNLGLVFNELGRYEEAKEAHTRVLALWEKTLGPEHPDVALALNNLGVVYESLGKYEESQRAHERALALRQKVLGPTHPEVANSLSNLATALRRQGRYAEAREKYTRSLALHEKGVGPTHPDLAFPLFGLSRLLLETDKPAEALPLIERALKLAPENMRAEGQFTQAQALWETHGDRERALALATQVREAWLSVGRKSDAEQVSKWLEERTHPSPAPRKPGPPLPGKKKRPRR